VDTASILLCGNSAENTKVSTSELKMVHGEEFILRYTLPHICIRKG
jgi:hypothetical protein